jgi:retron-type reverse transcriptase
MGQLLAAIADPGNLRLAFWKASKGKRAKADCRAFQESLDTNLGALRAELLAGQVRVGNYHYFTIHDPKERTICAAQFRERVLHHALMNVCEPVLERAAVFDSYACRRGKGQLAAVRRAESYARRYGWFLKLDVRKYFDSVDHTVLRRLLRQKFKDAVVLALFDQVLASYQTAPGSGLPIGNLTSQHFANFYLAPLDRFIKEHLRRGAYVRYMDDFVVWGESGTDLRGV